MNKECGIVVLGSCIIDIVIQSQNLPKSGDSIVSEKISIQVGGKASNQAIAISRLGKKVFLLTSVGNDFFGKMAIDLWKNEGINLSYAKIADEDITGLGIVAIDKSGNNFTLSYLGANLKVTCRDIDNAAHAFQNSKVFSAHLNLPMDVLTYALQTAKSYNLITVVNLSPYDEIPLSTYKLIDIATLNQNEAAKFFNSSMEDFSSVCIAGRNIINRGVKHVVISLGKEGIVIFGKNMEQHIPAYAVPVIDTTGAGDALNAGIAVSLADGVSFESAVLFANKVAALSVTRYGTWSSMPFIDEVNSFNK